MKCGSLLRIFCLVITARIRRMRKVIFSVCVSVYMVGVPPSGPSIGGYSSQDWMGLPPPPRPPRKEQQRSTWYTAGCMSLAFTQEDCLVTVRFLFSVDSVRDRRPASVHVLVASTAHVRHREDAGFQALRPVRQGRPGDDSLTLTSWNRCVLYSSNSLGTTLAWWNFCLFKHTFTVCFAWHIGAKRSKNGNGNKALVFVLHEWHGYVFSRFFIVKPF